MIISGRFEVDLSNRDLRIQVGNYKGAWKIPLINGFEFTSNIFDAILKLEVFSENNLEKVATEKLLKKDD